MFLSHGEHVVGLYALGAPRIRLRGNAAAGRCGLVDADVCSLPRMASQLVFEIDDGSVEPAVSAPLTPAQRAGAWLSPTAGYRWSGGDSTVREGPRSTSLGLDALRPMRNRRTETSQPRRPSHGRPLWSSQPVIASPRSPVASRRSRLTGRLSTYRALATRTTCSEIKLVLQVVGKTLARRRSAVLHE